MIDVGSFLKARYNDVLDVAIMDHLYYNKNPLSVGEIAQLFGKQERTIRNHIAWLLERGDLQTEKKPTVRAGRGRIPERYFFSEALRTAIANSGTKTLSIEASMKLELEPSEPGEEP